MDLESVLDTLRTIPPWAAYLALFGGAFGEYVFPPIPGDLIVVAGVALITAFGWSAAPVLALVTLGNVLGGLVGWAVGRWLAKTGHLERLSARKQRAVGLVVQRFSKYGAVYLAVNRLVPGIRGLFFVAAGLAGLRAAIVLVWSTAGAILWNTMLLAIGSALGHHLDTLEWLLTRHGVIMGTIVAVGVAFLAYRTWKESAPEPR